MDAVQQANSGHPGTPDGPGAGRLHALAGASALRSADPSWPNRDRFVLSVGHASMLLYAMLHLTRRAGSRERQLAAGGGAGRYQALPPARQHCPAIPEYRLTTGVETTTGPLGQGCRPTASAWRSPSAGWPRASTGPASTLFDYDVYALCSDGDMMEGVAGEAASLAGHLQARRTCAGSTTTTSITIEGAHRSGFQRGCRRALRRPMAGNVVQVPTRTTPRPRSRACDQFQATDDRPTLIVVRQPSSATARRTSRTPRRSPRRAAGRRGSAARPSAPTAGPRTRSSSCRTASREHFARRHRRARRASCATQWDSADRAIAGRARTWREELDADAARRAARGLGRGHPDLPGRRQGHGHARGRRARCSTRSRKRMPWLIGGSADLAPSTKTLLDVRRRRRLRGGQLRRPQPAFRRARARHGRHRQRHGAVRACAPTARPS